MPLEIFQKFPAYVAVWESNSDKADKANHIRCFGGFGMV